MIPGLSAGPENRPRWGSGSPRSPITLGASDVALDELTDDQAAQLVDVVEYGVLFFEINLTRPTGRSPAGSATSTTAVSSTVDGHPEIAEVLKEADQTANIGGGWPDPMILPACSSILYARDPADRRRYLLIELGRPTTVRRCRTCWIMTPPSPERVFGRQSPTENPADRIGNLMPLDDSATPSSSPTPT